MQIYLLFLVILINFYIEKYFCIFVIVIVHRRYTQKNIIKKTVVLSTHISRKLVILLIVLFRFYHLTRAIKLSF